jgi:hypothetical protein
MTKRPRDNESETNPKRKKLDLDSSEEPELQKKTTITEKD